MKQLSSLSIFFPSLNDAKILPYLITKSVINARKVTDNFEIIVINDGSTDDTKEVLKAMKKQFRQLRVIQHYKNRGYGAALISGINASRKDWVFYTDGDGQYDMDDLPKFVGLVSKKVDVVNGFKMNRSDNLIRQICGGLYNGFLKNNVLLPISDVDCDFRLMRRSVLKKVHLTSNSGAICFELIRKLDQVGARFIEAGVIHHARPYGKSQFFTPKNIFRTLKDDFSFLTKKRFLIPFLPSRRRINRVAIEQKIS